MYCKNCSHQIPEGSAFCPSCGAPVGAGNAFCSDCGNNTPAGVPVCTRCGKAVPPPQGAAPSYAPPAGAPGYAPSGQPGGAPGYTPPGQPQGAAPGYVPPGSNVPGYVPPGYAGGTYYEQKSKIAAGLLGIFLGYLGIHNFYLGFTNKAVIQLVVSLVGGIFTCGISTAGIGIWAIVEAVMIFTGSIAVDAHGVPLKD